MEEVYPLLPKLWSKMSALAGATVLVPLCGKTLDLKWLANRGYQVVGIDVSAKALHAVMDDVDEPFIEDSSHGFTIYRSDNIKLWEGDFLNLPVTAVPTPNVIYDKASIVALPPDMRKEYTNKILQLCGNQTEILLQTFCYNQNEMNGPPFSVDKQEINRHYGQQFDIHLLHQQSKFEELKKFQHRGLSSYLTEKVFRLKPKT